MDHSEQLGYIVHLLDDESPVVRTGITSALASFGPGLGPALARESLILDEDQRVIVRDLLLEPRADLLRRAWKQWFRIEDDTLRLEAALTHLARFQDGWVETDSLVDLLDGLADAFRASGAAAGPRELSAFLFTERLRGDSEDYFHPRNSNLAAVIRTGHGLPISLCLIYMFVGRRLGIPVVGCNYPRHFLARVTENGESFLVDCFAGGRFHSVTDLLAEAGDETTAARTAVAATPEPRTLVARVLNNLIQAYGRNQRRMEAGLAQDLLKDMYRADEMPEVLSPPEFRAGQIVRHRRYGYRGVIVDFDLVCRAGMSWYLGNATQPDRNQPWYSVLVDGTSQVTYAAEDSLIADDSPELVAHPLVGHFFSGFEEGSYVRNARPWPRI